MSEYLVNLNNGKTDEKGQFRLLGKILSGSGVLESTGMLVEAQGSPDMTVKVSGSAASDNIVFITSSGDTYHGWNTASYNVTISANASGVSKTDAVIAYADTAAGSSTANNPAGLKYLAVRGASGAPTDGELNTATSNKPWVRLATVVVSNGVSSINSGNITDARAFASVQAEFGWSAAKETWTYASATTITVPAGATSKYSVGDKIKLTQTTVKYFYIVGVASTTLTITGGTDHTLANAAISNNYYSKLTTPVGFPHWFAYTPTFTGFSANPTAIVTFRILGRECHLNYAGTANGTSNANSLTITLPVTAATRASGYWDSLSTVTDNGSTSTSPGLVRVASAGTTAGLYKDATGANNWTTSGAKGANFNFRYEI